VLAGHAAACLSAFRFLIVSVVIARHKASIQRLVRAKEAEIERKRGRVPGTPGVALQDGQGLVALADIMVTWVCTDVANSTRLWEWNPGEWGQHMQMPGDS
jgi:hypothetical protein